jgi:hypothetical protein
MRYLRILRYLIEGVLTTTLMEVFMESIEKIAAKFCIGILEMKLDL